MDEICAWIAEHDPTLSIDKLLSRPIDSAFMELHVAQRSGRISHAEASAIAAKLHALLSEHREAIEVLNEIGRRAMNGRKAGKHHAAGDSAIKRAWNTRRQRQQKGALP